MRRFLSTCMLLAVLASPAAVQAQRFFEVRLGAYFPDTEPLRDSGTGFVFEAGMGHRYSERIALEAMAAYVLASAPAYSLPGGEATVEVIPITAHIILSHIQGGVRPYVKLGGGYFYASYDEPLGSKESGSGLGLRLGAGISYLTITIEYEYLMAEPDIGGGSLAVSGSVLSIGVAF